jgi:hypothetical protein
MGTDQLSRPRTNGFRQVTTDVYSQNKCYTTAVQEMMRNNRRIFTVRPFALIFRVAMPRHNAEVKKTLPK